jgi:small RNA 2'-O-methyltransferase
VLDLGCGDGHLLARLAASSQFSRLVGIDIDPRAVATARATLALPTQGHDARTQVLCDSFEDPGHRWAGFDAAVMLETIEHVDPGRLSRVEEAVFETMQPGTVLITTPNQEFNVLHGLAPGERRHWDHRFEWPRARFRHWARGVASRRGYTVSFVDIGPADPDLGS